MFFFALTKIVPSGSPDDTIVFIRDTFRECEALQRGLFPSGYSVKAYLIDRPVLFLSLWYAATDTSFPMYSDYACVRKLSLGVLLESLELNYFIKIPSFHGTI